jgi:UDP-galactopyranose mutase
MKTTTYDWLIVGAGFTGATLAERLASQCDQKVLLIDRRPHIGGNAYDEVDESGLLIHRYGPHIFHTNSQKIWDYLSKFTQWRPYAHHVRGSIDGQMVPIPFNLNTLDTLFPAKQAKQLGDKLIKRFGIDVKVPILKLREIEDNELRQLGDFIYEKVFLHYTEKQWGMRPEELDPGVTARVPVFIGRDDRYFQDEYQSMPRDGYTALFDRMLRHPNIHVEMNTDFTSLPATTAKRIVFTGSIDAFFNYEAGELPYRSLRFDFVTEKQEYFQPVGTVNYPNDFDYTRITEMKRLSGQTSSVTALAYEYPEAYRRGVNIPYYPIPCSDTKTLLRPYLDRARTLEGKVWFAGRLGDYQYYNMDQACARALSLFEKELAPAIAA